MAAVSGVPAYQAHAALRVERGSATAPLQRVTATPPARGAREQRTAAAPSTSQQRIDTYDATIPVQSLGPSAPFRSEVSAFGAPGLSVPPLGSYVDTYA